MRTVALLLALATASPALAGGIGLVTTGGVHTETVYFYDAGNQMRQVQLSQTLPNFGGGFEVLLGDKDDAFTGVMRGFYLQDAPQTDPADVTQTVDPEDVVASHRDEPRHLGLATVGLQWGFLGTPETWQVLAVGSLGSGFLTGDHTEFFMVEIGPGASLQVARDLRVYATAEYALRYRKGFSHGANLYAGVRYFFD